MPQSFADGLLRAAETAGGTQNRSAQTDAAKSSATGSEPKKRRFPIGKVLAGALAAVLVAACVVIVVFAPGIGRNKHGAVDPAAYNPLRGRWTLTEVEQNGETVDPETIGLQMDMNFSEDGSVTVTTVTGGAEGQYVYRYTLEDNAVTVTAEDAAVTVLPEGGGTYDPETDTLRFVGADGDGAVIFSRVLNKQTLLGVWKLTRMEHAVDPSPLDGFDYDYLKWEKEQTWEEDAKPQPWYLEFTADGRMYYFLYAPDGGVQGNQSAPYTISGNTLQWSGWTLRYEAETDTICWIHPTDRREYYERVPEMEIVDPYRQKISDLRKQYPEYFDLYATPRLKIIVWQMAEGSYSCALVPGSDLRKEAEIGIESRGTTIEEMRMILSTYYEARDCNIEPEQVEVVPFHNPISSYAYEIDETYTGRVRWLLTGIPFECDDPLYSAPLDSKVDIGGILNLEVSTVCDVDGDGRLETCMLTYGPTSGLFTFTLSVYRNGTAVYRNTFQTAYGYFRFQRMTDGLNLYYYDADSIKTTGRSTAAYAVTIENGAIVLTDEDTGETMEYWGLSDPHWNMAVVKTTDAVIPETERKEITELRAQFPEYFGLDTSKGLKVYVWQMAENDFSCALISGTDERSELEIGIQCKGTTIEQMRLILSTYGLEEKEIEVVPFHNPISSYWYEIDNDYKVWIRRLVKENMPFTNEELEGLKSPPFSIADVVYDVDGDGQLETCSLNRGPTSSDITVVFTVYRNGTLAYRNTFDMDEGEMTFYRSDNGLLIQHVIPWNDGIQLHTEYSISIENGMIVLADEIRGGTVEYWGHDDPHWNMKVTTATAKGRIGGAWYCYDKGLASYPGYDELLLIEFDPDGKHVSFTEDRRHYEGYSWQTDADDPNVLILTNETTGDVRRATLETDAKLRFETDLNARGDRSEWTYYSLPILSAEDLPYGEPANLWQSFISAHLSGTDPAWCNGPLGMFDLDGDGKPELIRLTWDETSRKMTVEAFTNHNRAAYTGYIAPGDFGTNEGELYYTVENVTDPLNLILIDLDPSDGHVNLLVSGDTENGGYIYELHVENGALMCGHVIDGYCFLADSPEQELMLGVKADLFGAKFGYREVRGEALEPVDDRLYADLVGEKIAFVNRETNIGDGTLLHLVRALPCEIDGVPGTLEPDVYIYLYQWNEAMTEIIFCAEDGRWITVYLDGTAPYTVGGVPLADYFDNAPKG
jgi:hypothetical protein